MRIASISEAKSKLSALLDRVRAGETILIVDRGRPVARLEPVISGEDDPSGRLARLERAGLVRPGEGEQPLALIRRAPPRARSSVLAALLDERRSGR